MNSPMVRNLVLAAICVAAACRCSSDASSDPEGAEESLTIVSPLAGAAFDMVDDVDPERDGLQLTVEVAAVGLSGEVHAGLDGGGTDAIATLDASGRASLRVTLPASGDLVAWATGASGSRVQSPRVNVLRDPSPRACRLVSPVESAVLGALDDASEDEGFQARVSLRCGGFTAGDPVVLAVDGSTRGSTTLGADGLAVFEAVDLPEGESALALTATPVAGNAVVKRSSVTVRTGACRVILSPPSGAVFNARGEGEGAVADLVPGAPMDLVAVAAVDGACAGASLEVVDEAGARLASARVTSTIVALRLSLPDGATVLRARLEGDARGVSPRVSWTVDAVEPVASLLFPTAGAAFDDGDDADAAEGLQLPALARFAGIDEGTACAFVLDEGTDAERTTSAVVDADSGCAAQVTVVDGSHTLVVRATRPSGTTAVSAPVAFSARFVDGALAIAAPFDGDALNLAADADAATDGFQLSFTLAARHLSGARGTLQCGLASVPFVLGDEGATVVLDLPDTGCAPVPMTCVARAAADGVSFESAPVSLSVDGSAPVVQLLSPIDGAVLAASSFAVEATTSCADEAQTALLLEGANELTSGVFEQGGVSLLAGPLMDGPHALVLRVTDAAGNASDVPFALRTDTAVPLPEFASPSSDGLVLTAVDDVHGDLSDGFQTDVMVTIPVDEVGTRVTLWVDGGRAIEVATVEADGRLAARFAATLLPEGDVTLMACATDLAGLTGCARRSVRISTGRPVCRLTSPVDGAIVGMRDDADLLSPGLQLAVSASSDAGADVELFDGDTSLGTVTADGSGAATFGAKTLDEGDHPLTVRCTSAGSSGDSLPHLVTARFSAPALAIVAPVEGQLFSLASVDRSLAAGFQIDLRVRSALPSPGAVVRVTTSCGAGPTTLEPVALAALDETVVKGVTLPDDAECDVSVQLEDTAGNLGPVAVRHVRVDRVAPVVTLLQPVDGSVFGAAADADRLTPGVQLALVSSRVTGGSDAAPSLTAAGRSAGGGTVTRVDAKTQDASWRSVTLEEGLNDLVVRAVDDAGNAGTGRVRVTVDTNGPVIQIVSLVDGQRLARSADLSEATPGLQTVVRFSGERLVDGTLVRLCSTSADAQAAACATGAGRVLAEATLGGGGASLGATLPEGDVTLYPEARDLLGNVSSGGALTVHIDTLPPRVLSFDLVAKDGAALDVSSGTRWLGRTDDADAVGAGLQLRVRASLAEAVGTVSLIDTFPQSGTVVASSAIGSDGTVSFDVTLAEGGHRLHLRAFDAFGNAASTPDAPVPNDAPVSRAFGVDLTPPSVVVVSPGAGALLAADDLDPSMPDLQIDLVAATDVGVGGSVAFLIDGVPVAPAVVDAADRATLRTTLAQGTHAISATTFDRAVNDATSATVTVTVDSVAPVLVITAPASGNVATDADPETPGFQVDVGLAWADVENGRTIVLSSSAGGVLAQMTTDASGTAMLPGLTLAAGPQTLTATTTDLSGNAGTASVELFVDTGAPAVSFALADNPLVFGPDDGLTGDEASCAPVVRAACDVDGATAELLVDGVAVSTRAVAFGVASFDGLTLAPGTTATLQLRATDSLGRTGLSPRRTSSCDLTRPSVERLSPVAEKVTYVVYGNPGQVAAAVADKAPGAPLQLDLSARVTGALGGTVRLESDRDGVRATLSVTSDPFTAHFTNVTLPTQGAHRLSVVVVNRARTSGLAVFDAAVDVVAPGAVTPVVSSVEGRRAAVSLGLVAPGDDGTSGGSVAGYRVRRSASAIDDESSWSAADELVPSSVTIAAPGAAQLLVIDDQPIEAVWRYAVRAVDAAGNLAPLGPSAAADLFQTRTHVSVPSIGGFGAHRLVVADLDADGFDDLVTSAATANSDAGSVTVSYGGLSGVTQVTLSGSGAIHFGSAVATGDVDGDGRPDLLVGADRATSPGSVPGARDGAVFVFLGKAARLAPTQAADTVIRGLTEAADDPVNAFGGLGYELEVVGDLDGDGIADLVTSNPWEAAYQGRVYVVAGRRSWPASVSARTDARAILTGRASGVADFVLGYHLAALDDLNGDGAVDFALGGYQSTDVADGAGSIAPLAVKIVSGALCVGAIDDPDAIAAGLFVDAADVRTTASASRFGVSMAAGDFDGDGVRDLAALDDVDGRGRIFSGQEIGLLMPATAGTGLVDASAAAMGRFFFDGYNGNNGGWPLLSAVRDATGDGRDELAVATAFDNAFNEVLVLYGRDKARWQQYDLESMQLRRSDARIVRTDLAQEFGSFGVRVAAGHVVSSALKSRDLIVLDAGPGSPAAASLTFLSGP